MSICPKCGKQGTGSRKLCRACGAILDQVSQGAQPDDLGGSDISGFIAASRDAPAATQRPPLGLPSGSIRALLTLLIVAVVITQIVRGQHVELLWTETLMIALAHYFTSRRFVQLSPEMIKRLTAAGHIDTEAHPLYLPRHSIRAIIVLAFVALALYLFRQGELLGAQSLSLLGVVFAYFLGSVVRFRGTPGWKDCKAAIVLLALGSLACLYFIDRADLAPRMLRDGALGLVLFYFGSR